MAKYRVFLPARKGSKGQDITLSIEASNWLVALKASLKQIGEQGDSLSNILCETAEDGTLRVADPQSRRVFIIEELKEETSRDLQKEADEIAVRSREIAVKAEEARRLAVANLERIKKEDLIQASGLEAASREKARYTAEQAVVEARAKAEQAAEQAAEDATGTVAEVKVEKVSAAAKEKYDDLDDWYGDEDASKKESELDGAISDIFMSTEALYSMEEEDAMSFVLDQAMKHVPSEAGSVFQVQTNTALQDLKIVAARGPIGKKLEGLTIARGKGIVGFSALKSIKLTVNNVQRNPNFYGEMDKQFGFKTWSLLCVPIVYEGRLFGVIEMVNKKAGKEWATNDLKIIEVLADILGKTINYHRSLGKL